MVDGKEITISTKTQLSFLERNFCRRKTGVLVYSQKEDADPHQSWCSKGSNFCPAKGEDITIVYGVNDDQLSLSTRLFLTLLVLHCLPPVAKLSTITLELNQHL